MIGTVSGGKRRITDADFDLDLAFLDVGQDFSGRLLVMAYPASGFEGTLVLMPVISLAYDECMYFCRIRTQSSSVK